MSARTIHWTATYSNSHAVTSPSCSWFRIHHVCLLDKLGESLWYGCKSRPCCRIKIADSYRCSSHQWVLRIHLIMFPFKDIIRYLMISYIFLFGHGFGIVEVKNCQSAISWQTHLNNNFMAYMHAVFLSPVSFRKSWRHFQPRCYCVHEELQELPQGKHARLEATGLAPVQPGCVWWNGGTSNILPIM